MRGFSFILPFLFALAAPAFAEDRPECVRYRPRPAAAGPAAPQKTPADGYKFIGGCTRGGSWQRVEASAQMKKMLKGVSGKVGQQLEVYSCVRSQESQDLILCNLRCAPRFGTEECSGRSAANKSEHTYGTAADFFVQTTVPAGSRHVVKDAELYRLCRLVAQSRTQFAGGRGGITVYGIDDKSGKAGLHYDVKPDWCNWGACEQVKELGEGHCKRKKYGDKEARLLAALNASKLLQRRQEVARLERELARLRADCRPGDLTCRDSFKD